MKLLFITNNLPPIVDGVGDYTYNIAKEFAEHNHEVYIVCKNNSKIQVETHGMFILPIIYKWNFNCYKPIVKLIKEKSIDIVLLQYVPHGFHPKGLPFSIIKLTKAIKKCNTKLFTFFHEVSIEKENGNIKGTVLSILMQYISRRIIENSDSVATSIEYYKNMIQKLVHTKIDVPLIPIASNVPETKLTKEELLALKKELAPQNEIIISFFGIRNIQTSIDAITELKNEGYKLKILLIGKTSNHLPPNLPNDTIKTGTLYIEEIDKYLKISDIFILPQNNISGCSFKSGSFAAGLRNGLAIITAKGRMTSNLLVNKKNIIFTDFNREDKIKESILCLLNNKNMFISIRKEAFKFAKNLSWEKTYKQYINILK